MIQARESALEADYEEEKRREEGQPQLLKPFLNTEPLFAADATYSGLFELADLLLKPRHGGKGPHEEAAKPLHVRWPHPPDSAAPAHHCAALALGSHRGPA